MKKEIQSLNKTLGGILKKYNLENSYNEQFLFSNWETNLKPEITRISKPLKFENNTLTVRAGSDLWKKEISKNKKSLMKILREAFPDIKIDEVIII